MPDSSQVIQTSIHETAFWQAGDRLGRPMPFGRICINIIALYLSHCQVKRKKRSLLKAVKESRISPVWCNKDILLSGECRQWKGKAVFLPSGLFEMAPFRDRTAGQKGLCQYRRQALMVIWGHMAQLSAYPFEAGAKKSFLFYETVPKYEKGAERKRYLSTL